VLSGPVVELGDIDLDPTNGRVGLGIPLPRAGANALKRAALARPDYARTPGKKS
jgi:hypothetical protein